MGPAETQQAIVIARQYYLEGLSKVEIAKLHDLSRFRVARILEESLESGLVRIEINDTCLRDAELAEQLRATCDLHHAVVVTVSSASDDQVRREVGAAAAGLLTTLVTADDVLGIAWGRTLSAMASQVHDLPPCKIVQLTGIAGSAEANSVDLVRQLLSASQGAHYPLYAPLVVSDAHTAAALAGQVSIRETMQQWNSVSVAVVALGSWDATGSQLYPVLEPADHYALARHDVAAEMCAMLFDPRGELLQTALDDRAIAISYPQLMQVPEVVGVAGGKAKTAALRSVLRGRAVTSVVTDSDVARELLTGDTSLLPTTARRRTRPLLTEDVV